MLRKFFAVDLYVKIYKNRFIISNASDNGSPMSFSDGREFTTSRLLVGEFSVARACLKEAIQKTLPKTVVSLSPAVVIQPMEMVEGGLSEIEDRIMRELALSAGAFKAVLWLGPELSSSEVIEKIKKSQ